MNIFLSLGSNIGDRFNYIKQAKQALGKAGIRIVAESSLYETEPWGVKNQQKFLNCCIEVDTALSPQELLKLIKKIETGLGRQPRNIGEKWGPREIDIDILLYNDQIIDDPQLTIPHPRMRDRRFVLIPLCDIAGHFTHPKFSKPLDAILQECADQGGVKIIAK